MLIADRQSFQLGLGTLATGVTTDLFQCSGTTPAQKDELKI